MEKQSSRAQLRPRRVGIAIALAAVLTFVVLAPGRFAAAAQVHGTPVASASAACTPKRGGTFVIATANPFPSLDFTLITLDTVGWDNAEGLIFDRLVQPTPDLKGVEYELATAVTHNGNFTQWTIKLRPGVKFTNGAAFTSRDVVFSLKYQLAGPSAYVLGPVKSVAAVNTLTVAVTMKKPFADFEKLGLESLISYILPANLAGESKAKFFQRPIGTGPYKVQSFDPASNLTLVRNPSYWQAGKPYLDKLVFDVVTDPNTRLLGLQSGQYQAADNIPPDQAKAIGGGDIVSTIVPSGNVDEIYSSAKGNPALLNSDIRQAMAYAIDRQGIAKAAYAGLGTPSNTFIPTVLPNVVPASPPPAYNLAKAKQLVAASHVKFAKPLVLIYPTGSASLNLEAAVIQNTYAKVGIPVKLDALGFDQYVNVLGSGKFDFTVSQYVEIAPTAGNNMGTYPAFNAYFGFWPTPAVQKMVDAFEATDVPSAERTITKQYNNYITAQGGQIPVVNEPAIDAFTRKLTGLVIDKFDYWHIAQAWVCS